jgi:hypothetical protein
LQGHPCRKASQSKGHEFEQQGMGNPHGSESNADQSGAIARLVKNGMHGKSPVNGLKNIVVHWGPTASHVE